MLLDVVPQPIRHLVDRSFEAWIGERLDLSAVAAHEMVMVVAVGPSDFVARNPVACVDALDEPQVEERLQRSIHGRDPDRTPRGTEAVEDLLGAQAAGLPAEELNDRPAGAAASVAGVVKDFERMC